MTADDPRMAATMTQLGNMHFALSAEPTEGDVGIASATARIDNSDGSWVGTFSGFYGPTGGEEWYVLEGEGAYEGLTAVFRWLGEDNSLKGVILPARVPALPDPVAPPTE